MSRNYLKITSQFWVGETSRTINQFGLETRLVALYLMTNSHANLLGAYYLPKILIAHETRMPFAEVSKALQNLFKIKFCSYDEEFEYVWVHEMACYQLHGLNAHQIRAMHKSYQGFPNLSFAKDFYAKYKDRLLLEKLKGNTKPFDASSKLEIEYGGDDPSLTASLKIKQEDCNND